MKYIVRVTRKNHVFDTTFYGVKKNAIRFANRLRDMPGFHRPDHAEVIEMTDEEYAAYVAASNPEA